MFESNVVKNIKYVSDHDYVFVWNQSHSFGCMAEYPMRTTSDCAVFWTSHRCTYLFCRRYWAFWIWSSVPVMVMMRSSEPSSGSSILIDAPHSWRICLILWPPLPMMEPANWKTCTQPDCGWIQKREVFSVLSLMQIIFGEWIDVLHPLGWSLGSWRLGLQYHCTSLYCLQKGEGTKM